MKIAILSDIHGNLEALNEVFNDLKLQGVTDVYCLGDIIGYGPYPKQCLALIRNAAKVILCGNHEQTACNPDLYLPMITRNAQAGIKYALTQLSPDEITFLSQLTPSLWLPEHGIMLAHGSTIEPQAWEYVSTEDDAKRALAATSAHICVVGHTHNPVVFGSTVGLYEVLPEVLELDPNQQHLINVGSVGQPRDGDCRASYGILDIGETTTSFTLCRVFYDIGETDRAIREAGLPAFLAERLYSGR